MFAQPKEYLHDLEVDMVLKKTLLGLEDLQIGQEVPIPAPPAFFL